MSALYRFYLDGNLLADEPTGWKELTASLHYYDEIRGVLQTQDVTLGFIGDGYTYLKSIFDSADVCALSEIRIEYKCGSSGYEEVFSGTIFVTSLSFQDNVCKTKIEDDSFFAKINNNKNIKAYITAGRSKNDVLITSPSSKVLHLFKPCDVPPCPASYDRHGYRIFDLFTYIISFMTDGDVDFISDDFDTGGQWEGDLVQMGKKLRDDTSADQDAILYYSFNELLTEVNKKYNVGMSIEIIAGRPTVRVQEFTYFRQSTVGITLANPNHVKVSLDNSQLYAKIDIGSNTTRDTEACGTGLPPAPFPENVDYVGFKKETFPLLTKCNIDTTLNLVSDWVISSNVISVILYGVTDFDDKICFIEATFDSMTGEYTAVGTDIFNDNNCYYNAFYSNQNTLNRWNSALPNVVQIILGNSDNTFTAYISTSRSFSLNQAVTSYATSTNDGFGNPIEGFDDDWNLGNDPSNNYGTTVNPIVQVLQGTPVGTTESIFLVPQNGNYRLRHNARIFGLYTTAITGATLDITITITHYDSAGVIINSYSQLDSFGLTYLNVVNNALISCDTGIVGATAGDYFSVKYAFSVSSSDLIYTVNWKFTGTDLTPVVNGPTSFACIFTQSYGGTLTRSLNADFANILFDFEYPMSFSQYKALKADTKKFVQFNHCGRNFRGWIKDIKYSPHKNSKIVLVTNKNEYRNNP